MIVKVLTHRFQQRSAHPLIEFDGSDENHVKDDPVKDSEKI